MTDLPNSVKRRASRRRERGNLTLDCVCGCLLFA
jgi:hypothetical protein